MVAIFNYATGEVVEVCDSNTDCVRFLVSSGEVEEGKEKAWRDSISKIVNIKNNPNYRLKSKEGLSGIKYGFRIVPSASSDISLWCDLKHLYELENDIADTYISSNIVNDTDAFTNELFDSTILTKPHCFFVAQRVSNMANGKNNIALIDPTRRDFYEVYGKEFWFKGLHAYSKPVLVGDNVEITLKPFFKGQTYGNTIKIPRDKFEPDTESFDLTIFPADNKVDFEGRVGKLKTQRVEVVNLPKDDVTTMDVNIRLRNLEKKVYELGVEVMDNKKLIADQNKKITEQAVKIALLEKELEQMKQKSKEVM